MELDVSIIVVTFNSALCIGDCLNSVLAQTGLKHEILVVDNASGDGTVKLVRQFADPVRLLANQQNPGFGRACNQAFAESRGRYVFLLNPDACFTEPTDLANLCQRMDCNGRWGLAGTRVIEAGEVESAPAESYPDQRHVRCDFSHLPGKIAWVVGASMIIRRDVYLAVEGFDPGFFLASEETDLCLRIRQKGWEIGFVPEVIVRHIGFASERGIDPYETWLRRVPGIFRFWSKHYPPEEVRWLVRKDWFRASVRQRWYGTMAWFTGTNSVSWRKYRQYAGITEASRRFLRAPPAAFLPAQSPVQDWRQRGDQSDRCH
jgi:N-acetylglucosaminyl-diphospho-decaprenol L-rhamnosyltransferase